MWRISNIDNDVQFTKEQALKLAGNKKVVSQVLGSRVSENEALEGLFEVEDEKYFLFFNPDHMEHMDFIAFFKKELAALNIEGDITFGSLDGDNAGKFWGYRFDGKGGVKDLNGSVVFQEN